MSVKYVDNTRQVKTAINKSNAVLVRMSMDEIIKLSTPNTPKKTGKLRKNVTKQMSGQTGILTWEQPYAIYQEDKQFRNYTTAGTGPDFAMKAAEKVAKNLQLLANRAYIDWKK